MGKYFATCGLALALLVGGCAHFTGSARRGPTLTLDQAKQLMLSGQFIEAFQAHSGCVVLTLRSGRYESFVEPELDWVVQFARDNGLTEVQLSTE